MRLADRMDAWLEYHAEENVQKGARSLVWEDHAVWRETADPRTFNLETTDGALLVQVDLNVQDFSTTSAFWRRVES